MAKQKIRVGILFGGKSAEHEVSLQSAKNVAEAIDKNKYEIVFIKIAKTGKWIIPKQAQSLLGNFLKQKSSAAIDVVIPILHGPFGEDGTVQGLLKLAGVPFVGASVLGSAVGMDKEVMKRLLRDAGIPIAKFVSFTNLDDVDFKKVSSGLGLPLFVKPANLGSSIGVSKVKDEADFQKAVAEAFSFDTKIVIEAYIPGREIECSVLGNDAPIASIPGEIVSHHEFYSYEAKYIDENGASLEIPAKLSVSEVKTVQELAIKTFKTLLCEGLGRVDFFLQKNGKIFVNEINTIPGFTKISMYPQLWEASGISYPDLIDKLIGLAIERFKREQQLKTSYE